MKIKMMPQTETTQKNREETNHTMNVVHALKRAGVDPCLMWWVDSRVRRVSPPLLTY